MIYSWRTQKTENGYMFKVLQIEPLITPNEKGNYANITVIKSGIKPTRASAKYHAQKWIRYYKRIIK